MLTSAKRLPGLLHRSGGVGPVAWHGTSCSPCSSASCQEAGITLRRSIQGGCGELCTVQQPTQLLLRGMQCCNIIRGVLASWCLGASVKVTF